MPTTVTLSPTSNRFLAITPYCSSFSDFVVDETRKSSCRAPRLRKDTQPQNRGVESRPLRGAVLGHCHKRQSFSWAAVELPTPGHEHSTASTAKYFRLSVITVIAIDPGVLARRMHHLRSGGKRRRGLFSLFSPGPFEPVPSSNAS